MAISVLMTVFNGQQWLDEAIRSVLDQTYTDFEFIIVDDGSTDATPDILRRSARNDPRIRVISQENMGVSRSVNRALTEAKYEWIARFDADDLMMPDRLERQVAFLDANPDVAVASCFAIYIDDDGNTVGHYDNPLTSRAEVRRWIDSGRVIYFIQSGAIMRRDAVQAVGGYRPEFSVTEDTDLWNRIAEAGYTVLVQPEVLMQVRVHARSLTRTSLKLQAQQFRWLEDGARRRRSGEAELSFESFIERETQASAFRRLNIARQDQGRILYKQAAISRTQGANIVMMAQLGAAFALFPSHVLSNIRAKAFASPPVTWSVAGGTEREFENLDRGLSRRNEQAA